MKKLILGFILIVTIVSATEETTEIPIKNKCAEECVDLVDICYKDSACDKLAWYCGVIEDQDEKWSCMCYYRKTRDLANCFKTCYGMSICDNTNIEPEQSVNN